MCPMHLWDYEKTNSPLLNPTTQPFPITQVMSSSSSILLPVVISLIFWLTINKLIMGKIFSNKMMLIGYILLFFLCSFEKRVQANSPSYSDWGWSKGQITNYYSNIKIVNSSGNQQYGCNYSVNLLKQVQKNSERMTNYIQKKNLIGFI